MASSEKDVFDAFGQFLMVNCRDRALQFFDELLTHEQSSAPLRRRLQQELAPWSAEQQEVVRICIGNAIDHALHDLLFKLHEIADNCEEDGSPPSIQVCAHGEDVTELSDGLQRELFGEDGWIARYSNYPDFSDWT